MTADAWSTILGFLGGLIGGGISAWTAFRIQKATNAALEKDEIRKKRVEIIYKLLGSRYVLTGSYNPSSNEVQEFNTAMSLFSVYFNEPETRSKLDKFMTVKSDESLFEMLKAAAKTADLDLLDSTVSRTVTVSARILPLQAVVQDDRSTSSSKTEK
jgi:hypothetical protein